MYPGVRISGGAVRLELYPHEMVERYSHSVPMEDRRKLPNPLAVHKTGSSGSALRELNYCEPGRAPGETDQLIGFERRLPDLPDRGEQRTPFTSLLVEVLLRQTNAARIVGQARAFTRTYRGARSLATASISTLEGDLRAFGLHKQRARQLNALGQQLVDGPGIGPDRIRLLALSGVG